MLIHGTHRVKPVTLKLCSIAISSYLLAWMSYQKYNKAGSARIILWKKYSTVSWGNLSWS